MQSDNERVVVKVKYPCLVDKRHCKTDIQIKLTKEELNDYGEESEKIISNIKCNYQDKARTVLTADKKLVEITGTALFPGDICPDFPTISGGTAVIFGVRRQIQEGRKARNPDGSVNYTEVLLI